MQPGDSEDVLEFWFGALDARGKADDEHTRRWFEKNEAFDEEIRERFGELHAAAAREARRLARHHARPTGAGDRPRSFSRNLFRGDPRSFASDDRAFAAATEAVALGIDRTLALDERCFLYLPFMHSERPEHQKRCVELYAGLLEEQPVELRGHVGNSLRFAKRHQVIVDRFGRFPHLQCGARAAARAPHRGAGNARSDRR